MAAWRTAKVSALPSEEWVQQDNLVIPGYLQVVLKSLCWAVLLTCLDALMEEKYEARGWHSYRLSDFCVWPLETRQLKFVLLSLQFMVPVYLQCCKASFIYFHHGHCRATNCAVYRLFHKLTGKVVTSLSSLWWSCSLTPIGKKLHGRRNYLQLPRLNTKGSSWRQWTRQKSPKTKCHCEYQWQSWTLSFCFSSWSKE